MSDPVRLLAGGATDFEQHLLRSWASKQPSDEARARVLGLAGLGLAAGLTAAAASAAPASVAPASVAPASVASGVATASAGAKVSFASAILIKWLAIGAVGVSLAAGAVDYVLHTPASTTSSATATPEHAAATPVTTPPALPTPPSTATVAAAPAAPQAPDVVTAGPPRAYGATVRARETSTLDEEVATIERARRAVAAGDGAGAIAVVDGYDSRYPGGSLAQESMEIRIDALLRQGDRTTAERLASRFIAAHPSSPYVRRLHALLANSH